MALQEMFAALAPRVATGMAVGAGITATSGLIGARGNPRGIPAGIMGSFGGGFQGMMSGGMLGAAAGAGLIGAALVSPGFRKTLAGKIGKMLASPRTYSAAQRAASHPVVQSLPQGARQSIQGLTALPEMLHATGNPVRVAAEMTARYLERKRAMMLATGAGLGAVAGGVAGIPLGASQRAYRAGRQEVRYG